MQNKIRCNECVYRAGPYEEHRCDYASFTGNTRRAQPIEDCTYFVAGDRPKKVLDLTIRAKRLTINYDLLEQLYREGLSDKEIAEVAGCKHRSVATWRWRNGLPSKNRRK